MNIHEYQAKELLAKYGIGIPAGHAALTVEEAVAGAKQLPGPLYVVKAQIHAGGRGKGKFKELGPDAKGGVRLSTSIEDVEANARDMLGNTLVTVQTGDAGKQVKRIYVTEPQRDRLASNELAVAAMKGNHFLIPMTVANEVKALIPGYFIAMGSVDATSTDAASIDDEYADFQVPDDLMW